MMSNICYNNTLHCDQAFGATEAISDRLCMSTGGPFLQLAPLDLTTCDNGLFTGEEGQVHAKQAPQSPPLSQSRSLGFAIAAA